MKKLVVLFCIVALSVVFVSSSFAAAQKKDAAPTTQQTPDKKPMPPINRNIDFISGTISKIDAAVPGSVKVEIINDADNKAHVVEIGAATNILKVIDAADLKAGDKARIVAKQSDGKELALSVVTGNLKETRMPGSPAIPKPAPAIKPVPVKK